MTGQKVMLYPSEFDLNYVVHILLIGFLFLQDFLRGVIHSCDDEFKIVDSDHSLHLGQSDSRFLSGRGFQGRNLPLLQGSTSSLGGVIFPFLFSCSFPFISSTLSSAPRSGDIDAVFSDVLLKS